MAVKVPLLVRPALKFIGSETISVQVPPEFIITGPLKFLLPAVALIFKVPPVPTVEVPDTVIVLPAFKMPPVTFRVVQLAAAPVIVTVNPPPILTTSPATGNVAAGKPV